MSHSAQIHYLLHIGRAEHGIAGLAAGHHIGMVTKDIQRVGRHAAGRHMNDGRNQFAGDLVHIGDHQQQTL